MSKFFKIAIVVLLLFTGCKDSSAGATTKKIAAKKANAVEVSGLTVNQGTVVVTEQPSNDQPSNDQSSNDQVKSSATKSNQNSKNQIVKDDKQTISVSISIECKTLLNRLDEIKPGYVDFVPKDGIVLANISYEVDPSTTVLDVLKKACDAKGISYKVNNGYVQEIAYLPHKILDSSFDNSSGWMYSINGKYVNRGAGDEKVKLHEGDRIKWMYTLSGGNDLTWS